MPRQTPGRRTTSRKKQHVDITLTRDVRFRGKTTGLEELEFVHNALPEINAGDIDLRTRFLGRELALPLMVSCMTGGYARALALNRGLASVCESERIALGVGSQRQALENSDYHRTFSVVREAAPTIPVVGNIGAAEVARMKDASAALRLAELVRADAFAVHLNPLQEFLQPEGTPAFRGVLAGIAMLARSLPIPLIVKEIGAGLSGAVIRRLLDAGVTIIDVAGAGGTSWAGVEALRRKDTGSAALFWDWGIPTAVALGEAAALKMEGRQMTLIASGGIASGLDIARCLALGADMAASARPMLQALTRGGAKGLAALISRWAGELRGAMFLTGSARIADLRSAQIVRYGRP
ncbi:MAG TPA: type 2 isopentenyl-diphosphate Delta-isomerase [Bacteroidota bacterium]|nr:type 2 isopentenyl-diphosphate Delta-isomerase [Bacteroidota bacterium]